MQDLEELRLDGREFVDRSGVTAEAAELRLVFGRLFFESGLVLGGGEAVGRAFVAGGEFGRAFDRFVVGEIGDRIVALEGEAVRVEVERVLGESDGRDEDDDEEENEFSFVSMFGVGWVLSLGERCSRGRRPRLVECVASAEAAGVSAPGYNSAAGGSFADEVVQLAFDGGELVRQPVGDHDRVAFGDLVRFAAFDFAAAQLVRRGRFRVRHLAAGDERGRALHDIDDVGVEGVNFRLAGFGAAAGVDFIAGRFEQRACLSRRQPRPACSGRL